MGCLVPLSCFADEQRNTSHRATASTSTQSSWNEESVPISTFKTIWKDAETEQIHNFSIVGKNFGRPRLVEFHSVNSSSNDSDEEPLLQVLVDGTPATTVYVHNDTTISFLVNHEQLHAHSLVEVVNGNEKTARIPFALLQSNKIVPQPSYDLQTSGQQHIQATTFPMDWYQQLLRNIQHQLSNNVSFHFEKGFEYLQKVSKILEEQYSPLRRVSLWKDPMKKARKYAALSLKEFMFGALEEQDTSSMATLGALYLSGWNTLLEQNISIALRTLAKAADWGHPDAQALLGFIFASSYSSIVQHDCVEEKQRLPSWISHWIPFLTSDVSSSHKKVKKQLENMSIQSILERLPNGFLSNHLEELLLLKEREERYALALLLWTFAAEGGSDYAQSALGFRYLYGIGVAPDCAKSVYYYRRAAWETVKHGLFSYERNNANNMLSDPFPIEEDENMIDFDLCIWGRPFVPHSSGELGMLTNHHDVIRDRRTTKDIIEYKFHEAENEDGKSELFLGELFLTGAYGVEQDYIIAAIYFERAALHGYPQGYTYLGIFSLFGIDAMERNESLALELFYRAAHMEEAQAYNAIGYCYYLGIGGIERNTTQAIEYFQEAASQGSIDALYNLGMLAWKGYMGERNVESAYRWLLKASKSGHLKATYRLGEMIFSEPSILVTNDRCLKAALYFKFVAQRGQPTELMSKAFRALSVKDYATALLRYEQAAHAGLEGAQYNSAYLYEHGLGFCMRKDQQETSKQAAYQNAYYYYRLSARQGNPYSQLKIGDFLYEGYVAMNKSYEQAAQAYFQAAEMGNAEAAFNLGYMYWKGIGGLEKDLHLAKRYFDIATQLQKEAIIPSKIAIYWLKVYQLISRCWTQLTDFSTQYHKLHLEKTFWQENKATCWMFLVAIVVAWFTWWMYQRM
eukprot:jgi/Galph1/5147/GphlegSOOS_G3757.1